MSLKQLLTDDDAVSPVIGVILMVAVTVILAAVIASFVLGLADTNELAPQVSFNYDYSQGDEELRILVTSGDSFTAEQVTIRGVNMGNNAGVAWDERAADPAVGPDSTVGAGNRAILGDDTAGHDPVESNFELELVWTASDGDRSNLLSTRTGPDA